MYGLICTDVAGKKHQEGPGLSAPTFWHRKDISYNINKSELTWRYLLPPLLWSHVKWIKDNEINRRSEIEVKRIPLSLIRIFRILKVSYFPYFNFFLSDQYFLALFFCQYFFGMPPPFLQKQNYVPLSFIIFVLFRVSA